MKVVLRDENDSHGHEIGEVAPDCLMEVFEEVRKASVYSGDAYYDDFSHQIVYGPSEAVFEIILSR